MICISFAVSSLQAVASTCDVDRGDKKRGSGQANVVDALCLRFVRTATPIITSVTLFEIIKAAATADSKLTLSGPSQSLATRLHYRYVVDHAFTFHLSILNATS